MPPELISQPTRIEAAGTPPKQIDEYVGRINTGDAAVSVAHMRSPAGWQEPGQRPEFDEFTIVLRGALTIEYHDDEGHVHAFEVRAGQAVKACAGEWVRYSSPGDEGAEYIAVCTPAFSPDTVHREGA